MVADPYCSDYVITWGFNGIHRGFCISTIYLHTILMNGKRVKYLRKLAIKKGISYKLLKKAWKLYLSSSRVIAVNDLAAGERA